MTHGVTPIGVSGLGLMGGSLALALRRHAGLAVLGHDPAPGVAELAVSRGIIDAVADPAALRACPVIFVAAPLRYLDSAFDALAGATGIVTDLGSTKGPVIGTGEARFGGRFVGGHPMAGSEKIGLDGADADLFQNAVWVLTATANTDPAALTTLETLLPRIGARVVRVPAPEHDAAVAMISHLPYLLACALVETAQRQPDQATLRLLAASGFRDTTRLALSNPILGRDMCLTNGAAIHHLIPQLQAVLTDWAELIATGDGSALDTVLQRAAAWRGALYAPKETPAP
ncbi:MAG: prephenate dehydrogenase/arogenate dehydrogenase family protein [Candidatus Sericytochromatia bacterium]|nr:prephenate dehydrogenase/arogenate dehydrogenase family protein [Candidatus Sericytochromatia bacterium]